MVNTTPRAWNHICIRIVPNPHYSKIIKKWVELSGCSPLHLHFETPQWGTETREAARQSSLASYLAILQPHVARWGTVEIFIRDAPQHSIWNIQLLLQHFNFDMPALRSFYLDTTRQLWRDYHVLKGEVPVLTYLKIGHCRPSTSNHWLANLKELEITHAVHSLYYIHGLLQGCSLLTSLKLDVDVLEREVRGLSTVKFTHLQSLHLNDIIYLSFFRVPALCSLTFTKKSTKGLQEGRNLLTNLSMMLETSENFVFQELNLVDVDIGRYNFEARYFISLSKISLTHCTIRPEALDRHDEHSLWSGLHTLEFDSCDHIPDTFFNPFIQDNVWVGSLKRIVFFDCAGVKPALVARILACRMCPQVAYSASIRVPPNPATSPCSGPSGRLCPLPSTPINLPFPSPRTWS